jgi:2,3-bisphosphoglycerate-independent phosphoglycerate mutase
MKNSEKVILIILDGWGIGDKSDSDLINKASTPYMDYLLDNYANSQLQTSGSDVGLPDGQMGNSEVGHMNIGAGRVVFQDLVRINNSIRDKSFKKNSALIDAMQYARQNNKAVHLIGLVSDGGVHSLDKHLYELCDLTKDHDLENVFIHAITDGRDTDPHSGLGFIKDLQAHLNKSNGTIASLIGRYYTMDRNRKWDRIKQGYDLMVNGVGYQTHNILEAIQRSYDAGITDEFIKPISVVGDDNQPVGLIKEDDVVIGFNFRTDRLRQMTIALTQQDFPSVGMHKIALRYYTMTNYDPTYKNVHVIFDKENVEDTLGEIIADEGLKQIRIAETEKYPHVTFFFSGGREEEFANEKRIMIPSPGVATYDLKPEMSAFEIKDHILNELDKQETDFICLNFANCDMVGHTGDENAIIQAVQAVDTCLSSVVESAKKNGYIALVIADHGNADNAINPDGSPNTEHSLNPVPCILVSDNIRTVKNGILADVAPTILSLMGLGIPTKMTGKILY